MALNADSQNLSKGKARWQLGRLLARPFAVIGRAAISLVDNLGAASIFLLLAFLKILRPKQAPKIVQQYIPLKYIFTAHAAFGFVE